MRAIRHHAFGGPDVLELEDVPEPQPGPGQLRIRVEAAGVHLVDTALRAGTSGGGPLPLPQLPAIPGREAAGTVDAVGDGVDPAWVGRRAVAHLGPASGGYAELAVREASAVHAIPDGVGAAQAVAMIGTGRTALAVVEVAPPAAGDVVLVTAAAGGMGALIVQEALAAGATVVGLAGGPAKVETVLGLGAQHAFDYLAPAWAEQVQAALGAGRPVTLFFDTVGGEIGKAAVALLAPGARLVVAGWSAGEPVALTTWDIIGAAITVSASIGPRILGRPGGLRSLEEASLAALAAGRLTPLVQEFPLARAAAAHAALESRATTGKVVLLP